MDYISHGKAAISTVTLISALGGYHPWYDSSIKVISNTATNCGLVLGTILAVKEFIQGNNRFNEGSYDRYKESTSLVKESIMYMTFTLAFQTFRKIADPNESYAPIVEGAFMTISLHQGAKVASKIVNYFLSCLPQRE